MVKKISAMPFVQTKVEVKRRSLLCSIKIPNPIRFLTAILTVRTFICNAPEHGTLTTICIQANQGLNKSPKIVSQFIQ